MERISKGTSSYRVIDLQLKWNSPEDTGLAYLGRQVEIIPKQWESSIPIIRLIWHL